MTGRARTGIPPGAALPAAPVPEHRFLRHAEQVIVWLLPAGLAAAVACVLLDLTLAAAGDAGPHPPKPPPRSWPPRSPRWAATGCETRPARPVTTPPPSPAGRHRRRSPAVPAPPGQHPRRPSRR